MEKQFKKMTAKALRASAKRIETFGWIQGNFGDEKQGFCILGSIRGDNPWGRQYAALKKYLSCNDVPKWNDTAGRTKKDVLKALRGCARWLEHGGSYM